MTVPAPIFVDTSAFLAFFVPGDGNHEEAFLTFDELRGARRPLFTTTDVLDEVATFLRRRAGWEPSVAAGEAIRNPALFRTVPIDDPLREAAWRIFRESRWPGLSLTDCSSSALMRDRRIPEAFTFDDDFRRLGHRVIPGARPLLRPRRR
jgi:predicted nucleic acid-binding protein